ncbi:MAG: transposase [Nostocaceae cyanobacterium]|nr:transposase [Nostocaceae cyanobacterium]
MTQQATIDQWLELARRQYNYRLAERFNWYEQNRCDIDACPLICHLPELKDRPDFYSQKRDLVNSKKLFPEYKGLPSHTLQDVIARVEKAFDRWLSGDSNGKRSGKPRFKGQGRFRSIAFPDPIKPEHVQGRFIQLPKIGKLKLILHRPLPDGFKIKTAAIIKKIDGYYIMLSLQDSSVPVFAPDAPGMENTIGIDMGLKSFLVNDSGEEVEIPQHYRKSEKRLKRLQRSLSRKKKGSLRRKKATKRVSKAHLKVSNQRKDFHYKTAKKILSGGKHVAHEKLNIKGIARTRLAKSTHDAGWGQFLQILSIKAERAGLLAIAVNPNGTSQNCSGCGTKVPKTLSDRLHVCPTCGLTLDRDHNAAINIKHLAVGHSVNKAQVTSDAISGVTEKPALYA